ncbi:transcription factor E2F7-like [Megalops cyprinoides]|uniref:transcription factor E2F7-like n=1 Tax=Megalops cyprinoides TaxID=118141 RepID=UPI0018645F6C|nr:transcription factor E2F7-like [Megalops cyprinoides]
MSPRKRKGDLDGDESSNQKENVCVEQTSKVPSAKKGQTPGQVPTTPSKHADRALPEPLTPTANLKVLISAASPDMRDREMKKVLFQPVENGREVMAQDESSQVRNTLLTSTWSLTSKSQFDAVDDITDEFEQRPSRKQKSLGLLCQKFLSLYPEYPSPSETTSISLDEVATSLGVERRRIYDIVNVLESLLLVSRVAKNQYLWHGRRGLQQTLRELQGKGRRQQYHLQMDKIRVCGTGPSAQAEQGTAQPGEENEDAGSGTASQRKDKSLRIMSQKFVMLFLVSETLTVTLDVAAKILIEESQDTGSHSKYKTKVRRLYDIANILTSLTLIQKVYVKEERGRKPAFRWIGPTEFHTQGEPILAGLFPGSALPKEEAEPRPQHPAAYLPCLSQASVVMVYGGRGLEGSESASEGQRSPSSESRQSFLGKRKTGGEEGQEAKRGEAALTEAPPSLKKMLGAQTGGENSSPKASPRHCLQYPSMHHKEEAPPMKAGRHAPQDATLPSHYLYVPSTPGLNGLNLVFSAGYAPNGLALPPGALPALAVPYLLVPSSALPPYQLVSSTSAPDCIGAQGKINLGVPAAVSPAHFAVGSGSVAISGTAGIGGAPSGIPGMKPPVSCGAGPSESPAEPGQPLALIRTEPQTPLTPKEASSPGSPAFFQTPGSLGPAVPSAARRRGSAQRRLDVGQPQPY